MTEASEQEILDFVRDEIVSISQSKFAFIGFMNEDESVQTTYAWSKEVMRQCAIVEAPSQFIVAEAGLWGEAVRQRKPIIINDYAAPHPQKKGYPKGHVPIKRFLCIPVFDGKRIAVVAAVANKEKDYELSDVRAITSMMNDTWRLIRRKRAEESLQQAHNELEQRVKERTSELDETNEQLRQKIEELMHSEEELRNSQMLLREKENGLLEAQRIAHLGNWDWDIVENKLWWSDEVYRIFGAKPQQFGATYDAFLSYVHPDDRESVKQAVNKSLADPTKHYDIEHRVVRPDGSQRIVYERGKVNFDKDGKAVRMIGTVNDITERRKAEQEAHQLREEYVHIARVAAMGELTASLAHELKQPLAAIRSNAQAAQRFLANEKPDFDELREILLDIIKDNRRADDVIGRLRTLMRKSELQITELNINNVIREIIPLTNSYEIMRNISLEFDLDEKILPIAGDRVQLQQVILNLVLNASEALINVGTDFRKVVVRTTQKDPQYVTVAIKDRGPGIDEQILERLFEPFYTTKQEGLGMGLAISRSIIDVLGGNLWAENNPDRGATFYFTVPVFKGGSK